MGDLMAYRPNRRHPTGQHEQTFAADVARRKALFEAGASVVAAGLDRYLMDGTLPPDFDLREEPPDEEGFGGDRPSPIRLTLTATTKAKGHFGRFSMPLHRPICAKDRAKIIFYVFDIK